MVNASVMLKANIGLHCFQGIWSIVVMGVVGTGMAADGPASGAARFMFTMVSWPLFPWVCVCVCVYVLTTQFI